MTKTLVFDMDGTIADLYGVNGWLDDIISGSERPYAIAEPLWEMGTIIELVNILKGLGWQIAVTSWLAKNSNVDYDNKVIKAKKEWLARYNFPCDIINIVKYGTLKTTCTEKIGGYQILVDDEEPNRKNWTLGSTINPTENLIEKLTELVIAELDY